MSALSGVRVGVTATRKAAELAGMLERRGAEVLRAPVLSEQPYVDPAAVRATTRRLVADQVDVLVATTGTGMRAWFETAAEEGLLEDLLATLSRAEVVARGPKAAGAVRAHGLRELWTSATELLDDVLARLRLRDLRGLHVVLQEHGQSLAPEAEALRRDGARVSVVSTYRCTVAADLAPVFRLVDGICAGTVDAVTFTSPPAATTLLRVAAASGRAEDVVAAFRRDVVAACVGPATAAALQRSGAPSVLPGRARTAAMVRALEQELGSRRSGTAYEVAGSRLVLRGDEVLLDGGRASVSGAPLAVLRALSAAPGQVVSRRSLRGHLPSGLASSEHAVEMAVARLRASLRPDLVQTVPKRGYRLAVARPAAGSPAEAGRR